MTAIALARSENKQLRAALARTALKLLFAAWSRKEQGLEWTSFAEIAFAEYRRATGFDATASYGFAREMVPWAGAL